MPRNNWSADVRAKALAAYAEHGAAEAARMTGVPVGTVKAWASRGAATLPRAEQLQRAVDARALRWAERRSRMVDTIGDVAAQALDQAAASVAAGKGRDAQAFVTTMAILVDKAQLLSGDATSRHEVNDPRRRLAAVRDELAERRERGAA